METQVNSVTGTGNIVFAANATIGIGGQGEFLRQMVSALDGVESATIFSRRSRSVVTECIDLPFNSRPKELLSRFIRAVPRLRGRLDLLTLLSDLDFDSSVAAGINSPILFDGIAGQCADSLASLDQTQSVRVLSSLNTHVDYLSNALDQEHRSLGIREPHFLHPLMQSRMRREAAVADFIRVPSTLAKQTFVEAGVSADKIAIVPIAVDLNHFHQSVKPDDAFRILAVSSFDPRKGVVYLLEACERLRIPNAELMLIGSTGSRWARKTLSQFEKKLGSVRLVNMDVTTEPAANSYGMASVFVHPAIEDGFGLVIPQALACGIPVIATRTSGASELIVHGETGFVVDARRPEQIQEYIRLLASDRSLREQMAAAAIRSMTMHGYDTFARQVREFYCSALKGRIGQ